jgi:hypothetical protein
MANQALIKGELGVHTQPMFKGELIAKPIEKAMQGFIQADQKRSAVNAKRAADIEKKALNVQQKGSFAGVTPSVKVAGQEAIVGGANSFRTSGDNNDLVVAGQVVDNVNHANERFLEQNADYIDLVGEDGEISEHGIYSYTDSPGANYPSNVSKGSSWAAMNLNLAVFGGDEDVVATWNPETKEYDFSVKEGGVVIGINSNEKVSQSDLNKNIFRINDKFGTMMTAEATRQGSQDMQGKSRYVDYNKHLKTKGQIVSAFYDEMIPGVPSVYEHLISQDKSIVMADVDLMYNADEAKAEITKYYDQIFANEQANFRAKPENQNQGKGPTETQRKKNTFFTKLKTNITAGTPATIWGNHQVREVEWRKDERYPKNDEFTLLYDKNTGDVIEGYNLKTHSSGRNKTMIYTDGNTYKFFNNTEEDLNFLSNKLTITQE